ncbi:MAG: lmo0937 family membrane protein [Bacteroidetes bacterium]|nr:lmo0937 family membrane protein [Bacteroidota bacterium]
MKNTLYLIAVVLTVCWLLGFAQFNSGSLIHILLILAIITFVLGFFSKN